MKLTSRLTVIFIMLISVGILSFTLNKSDNPFTEEYLIEPSELARILNSSTAKQPVIFNMGPMQHIKGSVNVGIGNSTSGMNQLQAKVSKLNKNQFIVIYCGCCAMQNCPNVKQPYEYLKNAGFENFKILNIKSSLSEDWVNKGYPMN
ncbi:MAG: rhodanese-like domain-containing protein [Sporocytophaga sp.]|uniref:rhodanese-like domain-containing protein n=1 Tax=Sporocytophaga sp. TaxID=2231183 RepID=UPI001B0A84EF|nr:rhodanese-like domain-containing protein [Sporocytophaga sp.]MBO9701703.1 rhodanese-like domain-containing protein [Sporocytophaga sp.]